MAEDKDVRQLLFGLGAKEIDKLTTWLNEHDKKCRFSNPENCGAIGGRLRYSFTPTSIGVVVKVRCACREKVDVTDYDSW